MAVKTIALEPATYELLRRAKREGETFDDVVRRLARPRHRLSEYAGIWSDMPRQDLAKIEEGLRQGKLRERERVRRFAEP